MLIENAMILAAGLGTRMRPITDTLPKPLVPIAGKALIDYALEALCEAGCRRCVVNVHHFAAQLIEHLGHYKGMEILISDESKELLNSGGGLAKGLKLLPPGPVFVMNADLFWVAEPAGKPSNLRRLAEFFAPDTMDMAMLCVPLERTTGHNGKKDFSLAADGSLSRYSDERGNGIVYAGALAMDASLLSDAPKGPFNLNIYFDRAIAKRRLFGIELEGQWITAGTPEAIGDAENTLRKFEKI